MSALSNISYIDENGYIIPVTSFSEEVGVTVSTPYVLNKGFIYTIFTSIEAANSLGFYPGFSSYNLSSPTTT